MRLPFCSFVPPRAVSIMIFFGAQPIILTISLTTASVRRKARFTDGEQYISSIFCLSPLALRSLYSSIALSKPQRAAVKVSDRLVLFDRIDCITVKHSPAAPSAFSDVMPSSNARDSLPHFVKVNPHISLICFSVNFLPYFAVMRFLSLSLSETSVDHRMISSHISRSFSILPSRVLLKSIYEDSELFISPSIPVMDSWVIFVISQPWILSAFNILLFVIFFSVCASSYTQSMSLSSFCPFTLRLLSSLKNTASPYKSEPVGKTSSVGIYVHLHVMFLINFSSLASLSITSSKFHGVILTFCMPSCRTAQANLPPPSGPT